MSVVKQTRRCLVVSLLFIYPVNRPIEVNCHTSISNPVSVPVLSVINPTLTRLLVAVVICVILVLPVSDMISVPVMVLVNVKES